LPFLISQDGRKAVLFYCARLFAAGNCGTGILPKCFLNKTQGICATTSVKHLPSHIRLKGSMKNRILICALAAAIAIGGFIATKTFAADNPAAATRGQFLQRIADKLNLSTDQRAQIKEVIVGEKDTLAPMLSTLHDARKNLRNAIRASDASEASVRAASAKVASADADLAVERMKLYGKIAPILTDGQRQQLADLQQRADEFVDNAITRIGSGLGD
jgi:Spy/CpxP family protein refolding chaperone